MWGSKPDPKPAAAPEPAIPVAPERPAAAAPAAVSTQGAPMTTSRNEPSRFNPNLAIKGEITGREDLYLDGRMEGTVRLPESRVTIGPNGRVAAEIEANEIIVEGQVKGNLFARGRLELRASGVVRGDAAAPRISIQEGARFNGRVEMAKPDEVRAARAAASSGRGAEPVPTPLVARDSNS